MQHDEQSMLSDVAFDRDREVDEIVELPARDELDEPREPGIDDETSGRDERRPPSPTAPSAWPRRQRRTDF